MKQNIKTGQNLGEPGVFTAGEKVAKKGGHVHRVVRWFLV